MQQTAAPSHTAANVTRSPPPEQAEEACGSQGEQAKRRRLLPSTKQATPGSGPSPSVDAAIQHAEPMCCALDGSAADSSGVNEIRQNIYAKYMPEGAQVGDLKLRTDDVFQEQWCSKFFSYALPFTIPNMVSGPDLPYRSRWRRNDVSSEHAHATVKFTTFLRGFARRAEKHMSLGFHSAPDYSKCLVPLHG